MKKLTKKQRHEIYKKVLNNSYPSYLFSSCGLCFDLLSEVDDVTFKSSNAIILFPEFGLFKPNSLINNIWWEEYDEELNQDNRRICLMFCIEMTR